MLHIHHGNRCETLFEALAGVLEQPLSSPLQGEVIVVQERGMARWLSQAIARKQGIAANIDFPLPAAFIWRLLEGQLGGKGLAVGYDRETLLWQSLTLLPALKEEPGFEAIAHYLGEGDIELKGYQLARRIAELFDQYLIYRPRMVREWERGKDEQWQARLWRAMREQATLPHWAALLDTFQDSLKSEGFRATDLPERISLFCVASLSPGYIELLALLAEHIDLHLFILNPSVNYWGDIVSERELAKLRERWTRAGREDVSELYLVGNPLLASMGRPARDFIELWQGYPADEIEHFDEAPEEGGLLASLQGDILHLQSRGEGLERRVLNEDEAASIRIHACHGAMREIQVLHDSLLGLFETIPDLSPDEVLIAAPDIGVYAPYIEAVFGAAPVERHIPYSVGTGSAAEQPLVESLLEWLLLPDARFEAPVVMAWLELPAVARRLGLDEGALERIRQWVAESGIRWGVDGKQRETLGLPGDGENSWAFGLERLLLGYAMPPHAGLYQGIAPYADIEGSEAPWLGQLCHFVELLDQWRRRLAQPASLAQWQQRINRLMDELLAPSDHEGVLLDSLREQLAQMVERADSGGFEGELSHRLIHHHLSNLLRRGDGASQRLLNGRVSCSDMVAARAIPFRVICLLGMNDGDFPRSQRPLGFDLIAADPQRGDRVLRDEDRYLFLEMLLSAREHLHISYSGRSQQDNSPKLPSVLVSELLDYIEQGYCLEEGELRQQLNFEHPLHPFSPRNFPPLNPHGSYAAEWLQREPRAGAFIGPALQSDTDDTELPTSEALIRFALNPARQFLSDTLGVHSAEYEEALEENESFGLDALQAYQLKSATLELMLDGTPVEQGYRQARAEGLLPHGEAGRLHFQATLDGLEELADSVHQHRQREGLLRYRPAKLNDKDRLRLWLEHLYRCREGSEHESRHLSLDGEFALRPMPAEQALGQLEGWWALYRANRQQPQPLFPKSSMAYATRIARGKEAVEGMEAAIKAWQGSDWVSGEGEDPWFDQAFRGHEPLDARFEQIAEELLCPIFEWQV